MVNIALFIVEFFSARGLKSNSFLTNLFVLFALLWSVRQQNITQEVYEKNKIINEPKKMTMLILFSINIIWFKVVEERVAKNISWIINHLDQNKLISLTVLYVSITLTIIDMKSLSIEMRGKGFVSKYLSRRFSVWSLS